MNNCSLIKDFFNIIKVILAYVWKLSLFYAEFILIALAPLSSLFKSKMEEAGNFEYLYLLLSSVTLA